MHKYNLHNYNLKDKILDTDNYTFHRNPPSTYGLHDKVVCYFDGFSRKIIPLSISLSFPIIYDIYTTAGEQVKDITIALCPFTLTSAVFEGKFTATENIENSCLVITDGNNTFSILNSFNVSHKTGTITEFEVDIKILRNVFTEYPDCKYMSISDKVMIKPILNLEYYENNNTFDNNKLNFEYEIHPKTLIYLIQYISSKDQSIKTTAIIGRDATKKKVTGYDVVKSGIYNYIMTYDEKIKQKFGFTIPLLWFAVKLSFPNSKIIYIPN